MSNVDRSRQVQATVLDVLPRLGLAYAVDSERRSWGITRNAGDAPLEQLLIGSSVLLKVEEHQHFAVATGWSLLD